MSFVHICLSLYIYSVWLGSLPTEMKWPLGLQRSNVLLKSLGQEVEANNYLKTSGILK